MPSKHVNAGPLIRRGLYDQKKDEPPEARKERERQPETID
jgi:hypothetical protein